MVLVSCYLLSQLGFELYPESSFYASSSTEVKGAGLCATSRRLQQPPLPKTHPLSNLSWKLGLKELFETVLSGG